MNEVIVVGAGPAGSIAAIILAQRGRDVLLLDRQQFPRDKPCGDGIPAGCVNLMNELGMGREIRQALERGEFYPLTQFRLVSPRGYEFQVPFGHTAETTQSFIVQRLHFDALLQQYAIGQGVQFCQADVKKPLMDRGRVVGVMAEVQGKLQEFRTQVLIGADGVTSRIGRSLRPKTAQQQDIHRAVALRAYVKGIKKVPHEVEVFLDKSILPGYAWIFPTGPDSANIGLGMRLDQWRRRSQSLTGMFELFLQNPIIKERLPDATIENIATWQLNFGSQKHLQRVFEGAVLIGDAGSFINPLTGGGIYNAMISAQLAAAAIHEALKEGNTTRQGLHSFAQQCDKTLAREMRRSYLLNVWLMRFPWLIDLMVRQAKENNVLVKTFMSTL